MRPERRAVLFDLDDTLYPYRRFALSGFAAVASHLERMSRLDRRRALSVLVRASRGPARGRELQACLAAFELTPALLPALVGIIRHHHPVLSLPRVVVRELVALRQAGWRLGIVTNGARVIQARKAAALGVARYVDTIVFAADHGSGAGKPERAPFDEALRRLQVAASNAIFVGNDERCDVEGAAAVGLKTVRCALWTRIDAPTAADAVLYRTRALSGIVQALLEEVPTRHVA
jgi:putative hydrolase of the HAD superfamily